MMNKIIAHFFFMPVPPARAYFSGFRTTRILFTTNRPLEQIRVLRRDGPGQQDSYLRRPAECLAEPEDAPNLGVARFLLKSREDHVLRLDPDERPFGPQNSRVGHDPSDEERIVELVAPPDRSRFLP